MAAVRRRSPPALQRAPNWQSVRLLNAQGLVHYTAARFEVNNWARRPALAAARGCRRNELKPRGSGDRVAQPDTVDRCLALKRAAG